MNDKALAAIGEVFRTELNVTEEWELYAENLFPDQPHKVIRVIFSVKTNGKLWKADLAGVDIIPFDSGSYKKYLYRKGSPNGGDITPTTKFSGFEAADTLKSRKIDTILNNVLRRIIDLADNNSETETEERAIFSSITDYWRANYEFVNSQIYGIYNALDKDDKFKCGITLAIEKEGQLLPADNISLLKKALLTDGTDGMSMFTGVKSEGSGKQCSVCNEIKPRLHGFAAPFKYFTVDKKGYISNYFNIELAWKNYPVCEECAKKLYLGARNVKENLFFRFYRRTYMAVPRLLREVPDLLSRLISFLKELKGDVKTALSEEDLVMEYIASNDNYFFLDLVFIEYDAKSQTMKIKSHIEEVLPSRFRQLFITAREAVNAHKSFSEYLTYDESAGSSKKKQEIYRFRFKYGYLLQFFDAEDYLPIENTFYGVKFETDALFRNFMKFYRENYSLKLQDKMYHSLRKTIIEAMGVIIYLNELKLLEIKNINYEVKMEKETEQIRKDGSFDLERLQEFVKENSAFFDQKYKVGLFSLGILIRLVMNIQNANLKSTPFEKKMKGYHISGNDLENLYVEALAKLEQYQGHYAYNNLRKFMAEYFNLEMPVMKKLSASEISFFIVSGMELQFTFKSNSVTGE